MITNSIVDPQIRNNLSACLLSATARLEMVLPNAFCCPQDMYLTCEYRQEPFRTPSETFARLGMKIESRDMVKSLVSLVPS